MEVEEITSVGALDNELYCCLAPYLFRVTDIDLVACLDGLDFVVVDPLLVLDHTVLPSFELVGAHLCCRHLDSAVDDKAFLQDLASDDCATLRAFLLANKALSDALMAVAMSTDRNSTTNDCVHANWTLY